MGSTMNTRSVWIAALLLAAASCGGASSPPPALGNAAAGASDAPYWKALFRPGATWRYRVRYTATGYRSRVTTYETSCAVKDHATVGGAEASFIGCSPAPEGPVGIEGPWLSDHRGLFFSPHDSEFALNNRQNLDANETDETFVAAAVPREGKDDTERFGSRTYKRTDG